MRAAAPSRAPTQPRTQQHTRSPAARLIAAAAHAGWDLSIAYRTLPTPLPAGHGSTLSVVPDVITYTAQARPLARRTLCLAC